MPFRERLMFLSEIWRKFGRDNGFLLASAVSFYAFLSLFPLLLLAAGVLGFIFGSPEHAEALLTRLLGGFVVGPSASAIIRDVVHGRDAATGIGLMILLWSSTTALVVLEQAMNLAWSAPEVRGYVERRVIALATLLVIGVLLAVSVGVTTLIHAAGASESTFLAHLSYFWRFVAYCVPPLVSVALFTTMYKLLPNARVTWRTALVGGLFAGTLWEVAKHAFTFYIVHWATYNRIYGSLASVILLMVWINYSAVITILGAEFASLWSERRRQRR